MALAFNNLQSGSSTRMRWKYDVFVSFRGEDTRNNFTDHLFGALNKKNIITFRDDTKLKKGEHISSELQQAIVGSRILIVIFSTNYASSTWCLEELAKIADCINVPGQSVLPIFYDVSPSEVRKQSGYYEKAFQAHEERFKANLEEVQRWRGALTQVANLSGWDVRDKPQYGEIGKIIKEATENLEAIVMEYHPENDIELQKMTTLRAEGLAKMSRLKLLKLVRFNFSGSLNFISSELGYLRWEKYPFSSLPSSFQPNKLVELILHHSNIKKLWEGTKSLPSLRHIVLSQSKNLIIMPNFKEIPNLESLDLEGCIKLDS